MSMDFYRCFHIILLAIYNYDDRVYVCVCIFISVIDLVESNTLRDSYVTQLTLSVIIIVVCVNTSPNFIFLSYLSTSVSTISFSSPHCFPLFHICNCSWFVCGEMRSQTKTKRTCVKRFKHGINTLITN